MEREVVNRVMILKPFLYQKHVHTKKGIGLEDIETGKNCIIVHAEKSSIDK